MFLGYVAEVIGELVASLYLVIRVWANIKQDQLWIFASLYRDDFWRNSPSEVNDGAMIRP